MIPHNIQDQIHTVQTCVLRLFPRGVPDDEKRNLEGIQSELLELSARLEKVYEIAKPPMPEGYVEPTTEPMPILQFFTFAHLPMPLAEVSKPFAELAFMIVATLPNNAERATALRKLLESKDAAVRARLAR